MKYIVRYRGRDKWHCVKPVHVKDVVPDVLRRLRGKIYEDEISDGAQF